MGGLKLGLLIGFLIFWIYWVGSDKIEKGYYQEGTKGDEVVLCSKLLKD